jgi:hypothetical protein
VTALRAQLASSEAHRVEQAAKHAAEMAALEKNLQELSAELAESERDRKDALAAVARGAGAGKRVL